MGGGGIAENLGPVLSSPHVPTELCKHLLLLACGHGSMSETACLPLIISCILENVQLQLEAELHRFRQGWISDLTTS